MVKIAHAIQQATRTSQGGIRELFDDAAMAVMALNGGSAVPLWNTWLDGLQEGAPEGDRATADHIRAMFSHALDELSDISGAQVGDKTLMDAVVPATQAMLACEGDADGIVRRRSASGLAGRRAHQGVRGEVRAGEKLRRKDLGHARRRRGVHGALFPGTGPGIGTQAVQSRVGQHQAGNAAKRERKEQEGMSMKKFDMNGPRQHHRRGIGRVWPGLRRHRRSARPHHRQQGACRRRPRGGGHLWRVGARACPEGLRGQGHARRAG